jgi:hypothetical protein
MCGDFNDSNDPVHRLVMDEGFASVFGRIHGREARITHVNHNNREVGVDFIFGAHLHGAASPARSRSMSPRATSTPLLPGQRPYSLPFSQHQHQLHYPHAPLAGAAHAHEDDSERDPLFHYHQRLDHANDPQSAPRYYAPVNRLKLVPTSCQLLPRSLSDVVRIKRPRFAPDWRAVRHPEEYAGEDALINYWRLVSDHRPVVATFDVLGSGGNISDGVGAPATYEAPGLTPDIS